MKTLVAATLTLTLIAPFAAASPASERVAALVRAGDYETAAHAAALDANDVELSAWLIAAKVRTPEEREQTEAARALVAAHPDNPWSWFALVHALQNGNDAATALEASAKMLAAAGEHPPSDFIALRAAALGNARGNAEALALLDNALKLRPDDAVLLDARGDYSADGESLPYFARARAADPTDVTAWSRAGSALARGHRAAEGVELLQQAIELSPRALYTRMAYWRALHAMTQLTPAQKQLAIEADLADFARDRGDLPSTFSAMAREYHQLKLDDRACEAEERVLRDAPHSAAAASVLLARAQAFRQSMSEEELDQPRNRAEFRRLLREVLADPRRSDAMHGTVYTLLASTMRNDRTVPAAEVRATVEALQRYADDVSPVWLYVNAPVMLADRRVALDFAESLARKGLTELPKQAAADRAMYPTEADYRTALDRMTAMAHDAYGWVLLARKKPAAARTELLAAAKRDPKSADILLHLGRYYESRGLFDRAEDAYVKGSAIVNALQNGNRAALEALYRKRHGGSLAGFEAYRKSIDGTSASKRKREVLASRSNPPKAVLPFRMTTLRGTPLALDDLKGKVAVINFWGIWCGWCVRELPELQTLVQQYANDPAVRIVTINNDGDADKVRDWMATKKLDFPVLLDDGWLNRADLHSFPTTWFLDRSGRLAFTKVGWTEKLVDEFSWRIEALKSE